MKPGIYFDLPEATYFFDAALSSTQARELLRTPAEYKYNLTHARPDKAEFDLGHAVHALVLGRGAETVVYPPTTLGKGGAANTIAAREFAAQARADGQTPVKQDVADQVKAMAEAVLEHPTAHVLLTQDGDPEVSVFATDPETQIDMRARFDFVPARPTPGELTIAVDLKTARDASPAGFTRAAAEHGYSVQRGHYLEAHRLAGGIELDGFVFVVVESHPPYLVGIHRLRSTWEERGIEKARRAREILRECLDAEEFPGYGTAIHSLTEPFWEVAKDAEAELV